jgi:hypothetical protein
MSTREKERRGVLVGTCVAVNEPIARVKVHRRLSKAVGVRDVLTLAEDSDVRKVNNSVWLAPFPVRL